MLNKNIHNNIIPILHYINVQLENIGIINYAT